MPGLDLSQLSSNWKRLQGTLRADQQHEPPKNGLKRKRHDDDRARVNGSKRAKATATKRDQPAHKNSMGTAWSKQGEEKNVEETYSKLAKEHGISKGDISQAYGAQKGAPQQYNDVENGGLHPTNKVRQYVALDCEMVGTGEPPYDDNVLARISLVNFHGEQIYDSYVLPPPGVVIGDYRTFVSGIKPAHLVRGYARSLQQIQQDVAGLLDNRILVGHALRNDLDVLLLSHPKRDLRDTSRYPPFKALNHGRPPALRHLAKVKLGMVIQTGEHSSVEDARVTMMLFRMEKAGFEEENRKRYGMHSRSQLKGGRKATAGKFDRNEATLDAEDEESDIDDSRLLNGREDDASITEEAFTERPPKTGLKKRKTKKRTKRK